MRTDKRKFRNLILTAGVCLTAFFAPSQGAVAEEFTPEQVKKMESLFKDYLMNNPEVILEAVDKYRTEQDQQTQQSAQENLEKYKKFFESKDLPIGGNPDGDVTVVEFFDYNCGYCRKAFEDIQTIIGEDKNVRVVFQEMPILSPSSRKMSTLALAAHRQGKYFEMHKALMEYKGSQSDEAFNEVAKSIGLDLEKMAQDAKSVEVGSEINEATQMGRDLGIRGTPGFVIGDMIYPGYIGLDGLRQAIADARAQKSE